MSLAAETAKTASNMNKALTLNYVIKTLEESHERFAPGVLLDMINENLTSLGRTRLRLLEEQRIAAANASELAEVLS
jgi:hypothetical protein